MNTNTSHETPRVYQTITGRRVSLTNLTETENGFLEKVAKKYSAKQDWTRFAAWWNAEFNATGLSTLSVVYRVCQDLEARLGIAQGKVSPPDYRDFLAELIDTQFGSRQDFCKATGVDPGQLSRVLANRADLSMKVLQSVLQVLHANLVIQTDEDSRERTSVARAAESLASTLGHQIATEPDAATDFEVPLSRATLQQLIDEQIRPLRDQVQRLEGELHAAGNIH
jgi:transcriptional regulator with XRE-family HTH domain